MAHADDILNAVIDYATRGMFILPATYPVVKSDGTVVMCQCPREGCKGKHPAIKWKQHQGVAPAVDRVRHQFATKYRAYNISCVHGEASGTVLLDWDGSEGMASQKALERELGPLPDTPSIISGSGGSHQIFRWPGVYVPTRKGLRTGFDVRGDGGISVLPPSKHILGKYEWECDLGLDDLPFAELPQAWVDFITAPTVVIVES
jgi:hypothetical protein